jgi:serine protease Do
MRLKKKMVAISLAATAMISTSAMLPSLTQAVWAADAGSTLTSLGPNTIADIAQNAAPAVVNIEVVESAPQGGLSLGGLQGLNLPPGMEFFFNGQRINPHGFNGGGGGGNDHRPERHDTGSGFIVRPDGYIVTNAHVVKEAEKIKVTLNDKRTFEGKVVGTDAFSDLAVVKIDTKGESLPALKMGHSTGLRPGEFAIAIGSPLEYDHTVTLGIISAVGRSVIDINGNVNFIQTDAAINPGNSGGPLLNLNGEVIGVNTAIRRDAQNIAFSIPVDIATDVSTQLIASGKILRPWLGVQMHQLDEVLAKDLGLPVGTKGVVVAGFVDNSPAQASGLMQSDVIQKIDGKDVTSPKEVKDYVQSKKVSDTLRFVVLRKNALQVVPVNVGNYADVMDQKKEALAPKPTAPNQK